MSEQGTTKEKITVITAIKRANSSFRYWSYRRHIGNQISLVSAVIEWFRRIAFELGNNR